MILVPRDRGELGLKKGVEGEKGGNRRRVKGRVGGVASDGMFEGGEVEGEGRDEREREREVRDRSENEAMSWVPCRNRSVLVDLTELAMTV